MGAGGPRRGGPWVQALCSLWVWWAELRPPVALTCLTVHPLWGAPHPGPLPGQVGCCQEEVAPWESPPQPQSRPRARLGGAGTTRAVPLTLRLTAPWGLWPEHLSPATGTLQLEPHWAEQAGPPRGAGVSTSSPSCAPSPAVQEEAHTAVPRLLPQGRVPPRRPVPAAPPQPEAPGPARSHPHGPGAQQHAPQEQGFHQPWAQVTGTVGVACVKSGGGRREPCTPAQIWGFMPPEKPLSKMGK